MTAPVNTSTTTQDQLLTQTIEAHIVAAVSLIIGAVGLIHPGFKEPTAVEALIPIISTVIAGGIEIWHLVSKRGLLKLIAQQKAA